MIKLELPYDSRLIPGTAYWLSGLAEKCGVNTKRANTLCFVVETTLEKRVKQPCEGIPVFTITLEEHGDSISVSITDKGLPYVLTGKQREMLQAGLVSSFSFEQLAIDGQRLRFDVEKEPGAEPEPPAAETAEETLQDTDVRCRLTGMDDEDILRAIRTFTATTISAPRCRAESTFPFWPRMPTGRLSGMWRWRSTTGSPASRKCAIWW